jgi:hypothetical protein
LDSKPFTKADQEEFVTEKKQKKFLDIYMPLAGAPILAQLVDKIV